MRDHNIGEQRSACIVKRVTFDPPNIVVTASTGLHFYNGRGFRRIFIVLNSLIRVNALYDSVIMQMRR